MPTSACCDFIAKQSPILVAWKNDSPSLTSKSLLLANLAIAILLWNLMFICANVYARAGYDMFGSMSQSSYDIFSFLHHDKPSVCGANSRFATFTPPVNGVCAKHLVHQTESGKVFPQQLRRIQTQLGDLLDKKNAVCIDGCQSAQIR